jgi:hypothetical protein
MKMKHLKILSFAAVAAAALMAFVGAGTASATTLTGVGGAVLGTGSTIHANNEGTVTLTTEFKNIECKKSTISGKTTNETGTTVNINVEAWTFEECNCTVSVLKKGTLSIASGGAVTSSGAEFTATCSTIFGNVHCFYQTSATDLGVLVGGTTAKWEINNKEIPRRSTNTLCDPTGDMDATYKIDNPDTLNVIN